METLGLLPKNNPKISYEELHVRRNPVEEVPQLTATLGRPVYRKALFNGPVGSYKDYGGTFFAYGVVLLKVSQLIASLDEPHSQDRQAIQQRIGELVSLLKCISQSHGNWSQGLKVGADKFGIGSVKIFLPHDVLSLKAEQNAALGSEVDREGETFEIAGQRAREAHEAEPTSSFLAHAFNHVLVASGQGPIGLETIQEMAALGFEAGQYATLIPGGGGGLLSGVIAAHSDLSSDLSIDPHLHVVEAGRYSFIHQSLRAGHPVQATSMRSNWPTHADGTKLLSVGDRNWPQIRKLPPDRSIVVTEAQADQATALWYHVFHEVLEPPSVFGLAALLGGKVTPLPDGMPVVLYQTGRNNDVIDAILAEHGRVTLD